MSVTRPEIVHFAKNEIYLGSWYIASPYRIRRNKTKFQITFQSNIIKHSICDTGGKINTIKFNKIYSGTITDMTSDIDIWCSANECDLYDMSDTDVLQLTMEVINGNS